MKPISVCVASAGRFHSFALANGLAEVGVLEKYFTAGLLNTDWKVINRNHFWTNRLEFFWALSFADRVFTKFKFDKFIEKTHWYVLRDSLFDQSVSWKLEQMLSKKASTTRPNVFVLWANAALETIKSCRANNIKTVLECGSMHILAQKKILQDEFVAHGFEPINISSQNVNRMLTEYQNTDFIAVPSSSVAQSFIARGVDEKKLIKISYGCNGLSVLTQNQRPKLLGQKLRILFAGQVSLQKGFFYLYKAWIESFSNSNEISLAIVGEVNPECENWALELAKLKNVEVVGPMRYDQMPKYYASADVFVLPSLQEGMAMVIGEAAMSGLAIICTKSCGWSDFLKDKESCLEVQERSSDAIAQAIESLLADRARIDSLVAKSQEIATKLSWDRYAQNTLTEYEKIVRCN